MRQIKTHYKATPDEGDQWTACSACVFGPKGSATCTHGAHSARYDPSKAGSNEAEWPALMDKRGCWGGKLLVKHEHMMKKGEEFE